MRFRCIVIAGVLISLFSGCGTPRVPRSVPPAQGIGASLPAGHELEGVASWYGGKFNGRRTANGEIYDMNMLTAAHKTLPFHTIVRVTRLDDERAVLVRINDRGPFVAGRIIDLSYAAARRLGMDNEGTTRVRITPVSTPETKSMPSPASVRVQAGAFSESVNADARLRELDGRFGVQFLVIAENGLRRVLSVPLSLTDAEALCRRLREDGIEAFVRAGP